MAKWRRNCEAVPEQLARYVRSEWPQPGGGRLWFLACVEWLEAHPERRLPFGEHGDWLDALNAVPSGEYSGRRYPPGV